MQSNWIIAWRLLITRKWAMALTLLGVGLGVALFIMAQAETQGLERFFVRTVLGTNGAIRLGDRLQDTLHSSADEEGLLAITTTREGKLYVQGIDDPEALRSAVQRFSGVKGISEVLEGQARASSGIYTEPVTVHGIMWEAHFPLSSLDEQLVQGSVARFKEAPEGLLCGSFLARRLGVRVGDWVDLTSNAESRRYRVTGVYETGVEDIDRNRLYLHLPEARVLFHRPHGGVYFQITIDDPKAATALAVQLEDTLGHHALSWQEREQVWLDIFWLIRFSSSVLVFMVILLAGVGMFNSLALLVLEKQRELAILRAMGYTRKDVRQIFALQGVMIYVIGTLLGWVLGALGTCALKYIPLRLRGLWVGEEPALAWDFDHYLAAALIVAVVVFLASTIPARRAARLEPGEVIRGSAL